MSGAILSAAALAFGAWLFLEIGESDVTTTESRRADRSARDLPCA